MRGLATGRPAAILRFALALVTVLVGAEAAALAVERRAEHPPLIWYDEATQLKVGQMAERGQTSTVVVGTSMAWQGLVPEVLGGADAYNAGLAGGVPTVTEQWLADEVVSVLRPRQVVWGLSALDFSDHYGDAGLEIYERAPATRSGLLADADRELRGISAIFRQRSALRNPSLLLGPAEQDAAKRLRDAEEILGPSGERRDFRSVLTARRAIEVQARITPFVADRDDVAAVVRTVEALQAEGIEVVFVELPVPPRFLELYEGGPAQHDQTSRLLLAMADELDVPLITAGGSYGDDDFVDYTHLTEDAALRFSTEVAAAMAALP